MPLTNRRNSVWGDGVTVRQTPVLLPCIAGDPEMEFTAQVAQLAADYLYSRGLTGDNVVSLAPIQVGIAAREELLKQVRTNHVRHETRVTVAGAKPDTEASEEDEPEARAFRRLLRRDA